ncbi:ammonia monooxygenase [Azorhizobium oxalatiphilum]|uniref:Ammonia monooxygenase n=1 Tax=Azorhizobium oxalatiphilum TaxID=980631 RepID=A0A917CC29_9HYPH|nr:AbrB family transcriptional regulator [Azorhizobium oxalatiphilum]GGF79685.1 ammonia monooxygenase [Azorhizobium oxalatiphilum]
MNDHKRFRPKDVPDDTSERPRSRLDFRAWPAPARWLLLAAVSITAVLALDALNVPAGLLLGPMLAAIVLSVSGGNLKVPPTLFMVAQAVVGLMIASAIPTTIFQEVAAHGPLFIIGTLSTFAMAGFLGWVQSRMGGLPGTTAIWGSLPGAATAMTLMSGAYGADMRLVAFMQYLRVVCCALAAMTVAKTLQLPIPVPETGHAVMWPTPATVAAIGLAIGIGALGRRLKMPGGTLLLPMLLGIALNFSGLLTYELPRWVLALAYGVVGWGIGTRFTMEVLRHARRLLPRVLGSIAILILSSACVALMLVQFGGIDPLSAFLATSPGGADSVAIIATATHADVAFVVAMQVARFVVVLIAGPWLGRVLSRDRATQ